MEGCEGEMSVKEYVLSPQAPSISAKGVQRNWPSIMRKDIGIKVNNLGYEGLLRISRLKECWSALMLIVMLNMNNARLMEGRDAVQKVLLEKTNHS